MDQTILRNRKQDMKLGYVTKMIFKETILRNRFGCLNNINIHIA